MTQKSWAWRPRQPFWERVLLLFQLLFTRPLETLHWMIFEKFDIIFMRRVDYVAYFVTITTLVKDITLYLGLLGAVRGIFSKQMRWFTRGLCPVLPGDFPLCAHPPGTGCNTTRCWRCSPAMPCAADSVRAPPTRGFSPAGRTFRCFPVAKRGIDQVKF